MVHSSLGYCVRPKVLNDWNGPNPEVCQEVKNIAEPVRAYRVVLETISAFDEPPALPDRPSIAVLSFDNMSDDPEQEYFADGIAEDVNTALARLKWHCIARYAMTLSASSQFTLTLPVKRLNEGGDSTADVT